MRRAAFRTIAILICLVLLAGCGGGGSDEPETTGPTATPTSAATPIPLSLGSVVWTTAVDKETGSPTHEVASYTSDAETVIAAVQATNIPDGTTFTATWTIDGMDVPEATMDVTVEGQMDTAWITFAFKRDDDRYFPIGKLEVRIEADGADAVTGTIEITIPGEQAIGWFGELSRRIDPLPDTTAMF